MSNTKKSNLLEDAIADAKTIKEAALKSAQIAVEQSITPKIQSMLASKLQEELSEEFDEEEPTDEAKKQAEVEVEDEADKDESKEDTDESFDIDAILAEIEKDGGSEEEPTDEAKKEDAPEEKSEEETDETFDISSLLAEEEGESQDDENSAINAEEEENIDEAGNDEKDKAGLIAKLAAFTGKSVEDIKKFVKDELSPSSVKPGGKYHGKASILPSNIKEKKSKDEDEPVDDKSKEIEDLKETLNEVNCSNAKLLYLSKLLYNNSFTNEGKERIVKQLDKATTSKEAKLVYETLSEGLKTAKKSKAATIKESMNPGAASAASGKSTKQQEAIVDPTVARWSKLAGLDKYKS